MCAGVHSDETATMEVNDDFFYLSDGLSWLLLPEEAQTTMNILSLGLIAFSDKLSLEINIQVDT